jgi:PAS domain-containing protein
MMAQFGHSHWWNGDQPRVEIDRRVREEVSQFDRHSRTLDRNSLWSALESDAERGPDFFGCPLDALLLGIFVVGEDGHVVTLNSAADRLLARNDGLLLEGQKLAAVEPAESEAMREGIARALASEGAQAGPAYAIARASRPARIVPYVLLIARVDIAPAQPGGPSTPAVLVAVEDPDQPVMDLGYELRIAFDLVEGIIAPVAAGGGSRDRTKAMDSFGEWIRFVRALARVLFRPGSPPPA